MHRTKSGYSQQELGEILGGLDGSEISRYEKGTRQPSPINLATLELVFGVSRHELFPYIEYVDPGQLRRPIVALLNTQTKKPSTPLKEKKVLSLKTALLRLDSLVPTWITDGRPT